jgi:hypothetical protein
MAYSIEKKRGVKMALTEIWIDRSDYRRTKTIRAEVPQPSDGEIVVVIDKFALTANNVTYAASGDLLGYWQFYPTAEDPWGKVTVWGIAEVIDSQVSDISVGERLYGFFPMSSHLLMAPGEISDSGFVDALAHRQALPGLYNQYARTKSESHELREMEDQRCIFFPLFMTGFVIADLLSDNDWFDAEQIVVGSASSKTGFSAAEFIKRAGFKGSLVGLTGSQNVSFVETLDGYDSALAYGEIDALENKATVYIDIAGDAAVRSRLHHHLADNAQQTLMVGATHWDQFGKSVEGGALPGAEPEMFFAPAQIEKRDAEWGRGVIMRQAYAASMQLLQRLSPLLTIEHHAGAEACVELWQALLDNQVSGQRGVMMTLR